MAQALEGIVVAGIAIAGLAAFGGFLTAIILAANKQETKRRSEWTLAAERLGLARPAKTYWTAWYDLEGNLANLPVKVKGWGGKNASTTFEVAIPFSRLRLTAEGFSSAIGKLISGEDIRTGDPLFDEKAVLRGDEAEHRALFDGPTRAAAKEVLALGGWVSGGKIEMRAGGVIGTADGIEQRVRAMVALGAHLQRLQAVPVPERLAALAIGDASPGVRRNALVSLLNEENGRRYAIGRKLIGSAVSAALADPDPANRYFAATCGVAVAGDARATLLALVRDASIPDEVRSRAVGALGPFDGIEDANAILDELVARGGPLARVGAIEVLGLRGAAAERVVGQANRPDAATRATVARALGRIGDPGSQAVLAAMLDDADESVKLAAIKSLESLGDVRVVEKLTTFRTGFLDNALKTAANAAIAAIQSRAGGAGAGQLTVSDAPADAGALSDANATDGALSESGPVQTRKAPA